MHSLQCHSAAAMPVAPTLLSHTQIQPSTHSLAQGPGDNSSLTTVGYFYVSALAVAEAKPTA